MANTTKATMDQIMNPPDNKSLDRAETILKDLIATCRGGISKRWYIDGAGFLAQLQDVLIEVQNAND